MRIRNAWDIVGQGKLGNTKGKVAFNDENVPANVVSISAMGLILFFFKNIIDLESQPSQDISLPKLLKEFR
jgi:hypothetical protein